MSTTSPDYKAVLAGLDPADRQALAQKSNRAGLLHLTLHWGLILLVGAMIHARIPLWPLLLPLQGILIIFNFTLLHECTHKTPFRTPWLNEVVGGVAGIAVGLPFLWFRYFHLAHHRHTNDPAHDPELVGHPKPDSWRAYLWHLSGLPVWWGQAKGLVLRAIGQDSMPYAPRSKRRILMGESLIIVIFYGLTCLYSVNTSTELVTLWIFPALLGQPFLRLFLLAEHGRCPPVADMLVNSRTTLTLAPIRFLTWNMPYHAEHHSAPNVPFFQLPRLHALIKTHLKTTADGYGKFHKSYVKGFQSTGRGG
jgi:fatty acid desaturase